MIPLNVTDGIEYGILERTELPSMSSLLAEAFSRYEPLSGAVGLSAPELEALVGAFGPKALKEQLSVVARTVEAGDLVGALLAEDFGTPPPEEIADIANFAPIGALLDSLDDPYRESREIRPGEYLHLFMAAVPQHAYGRGIAQRLITTCLENGKARGYGCALGEATGNASQHMLRKLGFREVLAVRYKDFVFDGQRVFSSIVGPEATILMEIEL